MISKNTENLFDKKSMQDNDRDFYPTLAGNWYLALPYGFTITLKNGQSTTVFLPISPSNISISTNFATNMVPTLYGTVEEHSDVRYFDINIEGTTGFAPKYVAPYKTDKKMDKELKSDGRSNFSVVNKVNLGGFFQKTLATLGQIKKNAIDLIDGSNKPNEAAFDNNQSGYYAFHNLYKMLLKYKKDASGNDGASGASGVSSLLSKISPTIQQERKTHPIVFFNYKDGNRYNVVIRSFNMRRSADNPMLYYYSISMRGYSLRGLNDKIGSDLDQKLSDLGLNGITGSQLLGNIKQRANSVKGILGAGLGGINILGR